MKQHENSTIIQLSEKFDQQLLDILSRELDSLKEAKSKIIKALSPDSEGGLLVA